MGEGSLRASGALVNAHVIHEHLLRENGSIVRRPGPISSDGQIEQQEERAVEHPLRPCGQTGRSNRLIERLIHIPSNRAWFPFHGVDVKAIGEPLACRQRERAGDAFRARISGAVNGSVNLVRLFADVLHDVDLAAVRPVSRLVAHHPKRRPHSFACRNLDASLEAAVTLRELAFAVNTRGCIVPLRAVSARVGLLRGPNDQRPVFKMQVVRPLCVIFQLMVAEAVAASYYRPFRRIESGAIELVLPDKLPIGGG